MCLQKGEVLQLSQDNQLIDAYEKHNFHNISYDLRLDSIQWIDHSPQVSASHVLKPGNSAFVSTMETIQVPNDMWASYQRICTFYVMFGEIKNNGKGQKFVIW